MELFFEVTVPSTIYPGIIGLFIIFEFYSEDCYCIIYDTYFTRNSIKKNNRTEILCSVFEL